MSIIYEDLQTGLNRSITRAELETMLDAQPEWVAMSWKIGEWAADFFRFSGYVILASLPIILLGAYFKRELWFSLGFGVVIGAVLSMFFYDAIQSKQQDYCAKRQKRLAADGINTDGNLADTVFNPKDRVEPVIDPFPAGDQDEPHAQKRNGELSGGKGSGD